MKRLAAAALLELEFDVAADVYSVTSFTELRREAMALQRAARLGEAAGCGVDEQQLPATGARSLPPRTTSAAFRIWSARGSATTMSCSAPTASAARTRAPHCARSSKSTVARSRSQRSTPSIPLWPNAPGIPGDCLPECRPGRGDRNRSIRKQLRSRDQGRRTASAA